MLDLDKLRREGSTLGHDTVVGGSEPSQHAEQEANELEVNALMCTKIRCVPLLL